MLVLDCQGDLVRAWLFVREDPVAFMLTERDRAGRWIVDAIEVRPGYRGLGFARTIRSRMEGELGPLWSAGLLSPDGFAAFGRTVRILPGRHAERCEVQPVFVTDWDRQSTVFSGIARSFERSHA